jgi:hypothetical protein
VYINSVHHPAWHEFVTKHENQYIFMVADKQEICLFILFLLQISSVLFVYARMRIKQYQNLAQDCGKRIVFSSFDYQCLPEHFVSN